VPERQAFNDRQPMLQHLIHTREVPVEIATAKVRELALMRPVVIEPEGGKKA
jgi:hypothetical protein